jgi:release factor glutamine methyltransferase
MTHREAFLAARDRLLAAVHPTETPDLDARVLLAHALGLSPAGLLARWPDPIDDGVLGRVEDTLSRRLAGEPVAWITGFKEFLGMDFEVGPGLLVPRADTETLVEAALEVGGRRVVDVCTGTGCVAVGLAALSPRPLDIWAGDVSTLAVETARRNAQRLLKSGRSVTVVESNLLEALAGPWDLVVSNPPYLTPRETRDRTELGGWKEPALALDGGGDGLDVIRRLVVQAAAALAPGGWLLLEAADDQMTALAEVFELSGFTALRVWNDLAGQRRVMGGQCLKR